jgi:photosystem II stability/assembly factor-like uncharacterized protein
MNSKLFRTMLLSMLMLGSAAVAATPTDVVQGIAHQALYAVAFQNEQAVAVGALGQILESNDAGRNWKRVAVPTRLSLLGVTMRGERRLAVGQMGLVLAKDGAGAWQKVASGAEGRLMGVALGGKNMAAAVGAFGTVLVSSDAGQTWTQPQINWADFFPTEREDLGEGFAPHLYAARIDENGVITIAGELGAVLRSTDAGAHWTRLHLGLQPDGSGRASIFDFDIAADGRGVAVGQSGLILRTTDGGATWASVDAGSQANLLGVALTSDGAVTAAGMREMLTSTDAGQTWTRVSGGDVATGWYSDAGFGGGDTFYAVGHSGRIIRLAAKNP